MTFQVTAWNNGKHHTSGAGYGLKISLVDRDLYFDPSWKSVYLHLEGNSQPVEINVDKKSFWGPTCRELINKEIGVWLRANNLAPWPKSKPPKLPMEVVDNREFKVMKPAQLKI
jgi:hypothetical protein